MSKYLVVEEGTVEELAAKVEAKLAEGFKVTGGVIHVETYGVFQQAMVLEEPKVIKEYTFVDEEDPNKFAKEINALIQNGWEPLGGPTTSHHVGSQFGGEYHGTRFVQAMVKY